MFVNQLNTALVLAVVCAIMGGCQTAPTATASAPQAAIEHVPDVVTADIKAGIEQHIEEQSKLGDGYFRLEHEGKELRLKLVRVHMEYLANLGPRRHFACVDLASTKGDVYDVDFFLAGDPGAMTVTETTIHKINGQPYYLWRQMRDKTWVRQPVSEADGALMGVIHEQDQFEFLYQVTLPQLTDTARMWVPMPSNDDFQTVDVKYVRAPGKQRMLTDRRYGNKVLFMELDPEHSGQALAIRFKVKRKEKAVYGEDDDSVHQHLAPEQLVPVNDQFSKIAQQVVEGKKGDLVRARALYDHTIDRMKYAKIGNQYGRGDAMYACDSRTGNCTDYHSYFIALSRSAGIPARFAIGAAIPSSRDEGGISGYHCWAEFYAEGKWWPVDISEGDKYTSLATYYFGHHPANRIELSRGRDLVVDPGPVSGPINFLAYPVLEVAGKPVKIKPQFAFKRDG